MKKKSLVLGIGNPILTDDGIGPKIVDILGKEFASPNVEFRCEALGGLEILEIVVGYEKVLIFDAIRTKGGIPGDVYYFVPDNFKETMHLSSFHDVSFLTALELGKMLKLDMPSKIEIIAIEIVEDLVFSEQFSEPVAKRFTEILQECRDFFVNKF